MVNEGTASRGCSHDASGMVRWTEPRLGGADLKHRASQTERIDR